MPSFIVQLRRLLPLLIATVFLQACGGGGGTRAILNYQTDWSNRGRAVTGLSQRVQLFDAQDRLVASAVVNQDVDGVMSIQLKGNQPGWHHLHVELYSQRDLAGTLTGVCDTALYVTGSTSFKSLVGVDVSSLRVTPQSANIQVQHSQRFYATGISSVNFPVFLVPDELDWTILGGNATVDDNGLVLATSEGQGTVRATYVPDNLQASAVFNVLPFETQHSRWTILVYINAANDLYSFSDLNVNQMEQVAGNEQVRFVLQWKQSQALFSGSSFDGTRRYLVRPDTTNNIASELVQDMGGGIDMGRPQTLQNFITWAKTYYPADRYCLVVWNHGNGWRRGPLETSRAVSYDDQTGNAIQIWELSQALGNNVFDIVAWDASLMQMMEVAYEIQDKAKYVVGSEESPPGEGYPYHLIFKTFRDQDLNSTLNLTKAFVDGMLAVPSYASRKITQSVVDTAKLPALGSALDTLSDEMIANAGTIAAGVQNARIQAQSYSPTNSRVYRDIDHLCELLIQGVSVPSVQTAAANVRTALGNAVVWEGHNSNSPNSHGLSIDFSSGASFTIGTTAVDYALMRFAVDTTWNEWLTIAP